ncbi:MAG: hypothetical protein ACI90V_007658 [Bacillariaceae sp.]|jgi:hypothetical protein
MTCSQEEQEEGAGTETKNVPDEWTTVQKVPRRRRPQRGRRRNHQTEEDTNSSFKIPSNSNIDRITKPFKAGYGSSSVFGVDNNNNNNNNSDSIANEEIYNSLNICLRELKESEYWRNIKQLLSKTRLNDDDDNSNSNSNSNCKLFQSIVCYGIGNFGTTYQNSAPLWQLALAVTIRDYITTLHKHNDDDETSLGDEDYNLSSSLGSTPKSTSNKNNDVHRRRLPIMYYFEPLMTVAELKVLEKLDIHIISENERGGRSVIDDEGGCLFFMPHCPMTLYTNLLHANWDCLRENNILIFGNSLSNYIDGGGNNNNTDIANSNNPQKRQALDILKDLQPHWEEERLGISKNDISDRPAYFERAFNDSSFTSFRRTINVTAASATNETETSRWPKRPQLLDTPHSDDGGEVL